MFLVCSCHMAPGPPRPLKVVCVGGHTFLSFLLGAYVTNLAGRTPDWLGYLRFLLVPLGEWIYFMCGILYQNITINMNMTVYTTLISCALFLLDSVYINYVYFCGLMFACLFPFPAGSHPVCKYISSLDSRYASLFFDCFWRELFSKSELPSVGKYVGFI